jgi:hypothetical protein
MVSVYLVMIIKLLQTVVKHVNTQHAIGNLHNKDSSLNQMEPVMNVLHTKSHQLILSHANLEFAVKEKNY